jgi:fucose permease
VVVVQNLGGPAVGPVSAGWLPDRYGLTTALAVIPLLCATVAGLFWCGSWFYVRDRDAVPVGPLPSAPRPQPQAGHA